MEDKKRLPRCPAETTLTLIGNKWKILIIRDLIYREKTLHFGELRKSLESISQKVLTENLKEMEADGLIARTVYPEVPPRVEYCLTELGQSLLPVIESLRIWGIEYKKSINQ